MYRSKARTWTLPTPLSLIQWEVSSFNDPLRYTLGSVYGFSAQFG